MGKLLHFAVVPAAVSATLFLASAAFSQAPEVYHPGDSLIFRTTFEQGDAEKLSNVRIDFTIRTPVREDQKQLRDWLQSSNFYRVSPGVFDLSVPILADTASGIYTLSSITATDAGGFSWRFDQDLPKVEITVKDPAAGPEKPELTSVTLMPKRIIVRKPQPKVAPRPRQNVTPQPKKSVPPKPKQNVAPNTDQSVTPKH